MKKIMILLFVTGLMLTGCKKSYFEINQNPNQPTNVTPNVVLSAALAGTARSQAVNFIGLNRWMGYWSRSGNYVPDVQTETYNVPNDYTDGSWDNIYTNLNNYDYIEKTAHEQTLPFYIGVAKAMKAFNFAILVDVYNNVPYTDAFNVESSIQPVYDNGQEIYLDLISQLDSAYDYFETAKTYYDGAASTILSTDDQYDIMFGSSMTGLSEAGDRMIMWQKFTNTLLLKLLIHMSEVADQQSLIQAELAKIQERIDNGIGFLGAGESARVNPGYLAASGKINPFYGIFVTESGSTTSSQAYYRANTYAVDFYINTGDIRQYCFYAVQYPATVGSNYDGDPLAVPNSSTAAIGPGSGVAKDYSQDQLILSDFESLFLQAEAAQRGWIVDDPQVLYENAVTQNFIYLYKDYHPYPGFGDPTPEIDAEYYYAFYGILAETSLPQYQIWDEATDKLQLILTQKWAALNGINWVEAWTDYRRTGFPTSDVLGITHAPNPLQPKIPIRYLYPQSELNTNAGNVPQTGAGSGDQFSAAIFWDQ